MTRQQMQHTLGPWRVDSQFDSVIWGAGPGRLPMVAGHVTRDGANAARIVDCVNACDAAGLTEPERQIPAWALLLRDVSEHFAGSAAPLGLRAWALLAELEGGERLTCPECGTPHDGLVECPHRPPP